VCRLCVSSNSQRLVFDPLADESLAGCRALLRGQCAGDNLVQALWPGRTAFCQQLWNLQSTVVPPNDLPTSKSLEHCGLRLSLRVSYRKLVVVTGTEWQIFGRAFLNSRSSAEDSRRILPLSFVPASIFLACGWRPLSATYCRETTFLRHQVPSRSRTAACRRLS